MQVYNGIDYNSLFVFHELVRLGSVSDVASFLNTNVSKISRTIKNLEKSLNSILFFRKRKGFELTPEGMVLFEKTKSILNLHKEVSDYFLGKKSSKNNLAILNLNIITTKGYSGYCTALWVQEFMKIDRNIKLRLFTSDIDLNEANFYGDLSISNQRLHLDNFDEIKIVDTSWCFYASKSYLASKKHTPRVLSDLENHDIISFDLGYHHNKQVVDWFLTEINISPKYKVNNIYNILSFVDNGFGIAFLPKDFVMKNSKNIENIVCLENIGEKKFAQYLIYKKRSLEKEQVRKFIEFLKARFY